MKIYIVDGTPVLDGTPKELAQYQRMVQPARKRATPKKKRKDENNG